MLLPDTPAGQAMAWVLSIVNGETPVPDTAEIETRFAPSFLAAVPAMALSQTFQQLHDGFAPVAVTEINRCFVLEDATGCSTSPWWCW